MISNVNLTTTEDFALAVAGSFRRSKFRTMRQFVEDEVYLPDGPHKGEQFRCETQPFSKLWFDLVDDQHWYECVITGPSQSGKTLIGFCCPAMYHLFEREETIIAAVPDLDIANDKWVQDLEPTIANTRYRDLLPAKVGKKQSLIEFKNGTALRWMTAGGSDKSRAAFTASTVCMTETDGFDTRMETSDEANKIEQIEARMRAFPLIRRRIYKECTVSIEEGHTWHRYTQGTQSRIAIQCQHCDAYVSPEREHFTGWENAKTDVEAVNRSRFFCPECGEVWSEQDRIDANLQNVIIHRGQEIVDGRVTGKRAETHTLGFRWSAVNNLLVPAGDVGLDEWKAARSVDEDDEQRKMAQFVWAIPYRASDVDEVPLTVESVTDAHSSLGRGVCPDDTQWVSVGVDVNKPVLHWTAIAWVVRDSYVRGHIIDFGKQGIKQDREWADCLFDALVKLNDNLGVGWSGLPPAKTAFSRAVVDSKWSTPLVIKSIKKLKSRRWKPYQGRGSGDWKQTVYTRPKKVGGNITWVGTNCHEEYVQSHRERVTIADANWWKTWLHTRLLMTPVDEDSDPPNGALTIFDSASEVGDVNEFARHLTAEKETTSFERGRGNVKKWVAIRSANHWLDSTYMACVAGNYYWDKFVGKPKTPGRKVSPGQISMKGNHGRG